MAAAADEGRSAVDPEGEERPGAPRACAPLGSQPAPPGGGRSGGERPAVIPAAPRPGSAAVGDPRPSSCEVALERPRAGTARRSPYPEAGGGQRGLASRPACAFGSRAGSR